MGPLKKNHRFIFSTGTMPWLDTCSESEYASGLAELGHVRYDHEPSYRTEFGKALGAKRRWYVRWIDNEAIRFINLLGHDMRQAATLPEKKAMLRGALQDTLALGIKHMVDLAIVRKYKPGHYEGNGMCNRHGVSCATNSYIIHYNIHRLLCMYLEVQEQHLAHLSPDDVLSVAELYQFYGNHLCRDHVVHVVPEGTLQAEKPVLIPCKGDLRLPPKGVLTYDEMIRNPEKFAWFEQELFASHYIDAHYRFQNKKGHQTELAMMVVHLAARKYFYPKTIPAMKPITLVDIRRFFEFRYDFRMDRALPVVRKNRQAIDAFVAQLHWLDKLPGC